MSNKNEKTVRVNHSKEVIGVYRYTLENLTIFREKQLSYGQSEGGKFGWFDKRPVFWAKTEEEAKDKFSSL
jgi:hypothetical protein